MWISDFRLDGWAQIQPKADLPGRLWIFGLDGSAQNWAQSWPASLPDWGQVASSASLPLLLFTWIHSIFPLPPVSLTFFALDLSSDFLFAYFAGNTRPGPVFNLFSEISICHSIHWDFQSNSHFHSFQCQWASSPLKLSHSTFHFHPATLFCPCPYPHLPTHPYPPYFQTFCFQLYLVLPLFGELSTFSSQYLTFCNLSCFNGQCV